MSSTNINSVNIEIENIIYNLKADVPELLDLGPDEAGDLQYSTLLQYSTSQYSIVQTQARMQYSTGEGRLPRLVVSVSRSQPMMSSIRCDARISRTDTQHRSTIKLVPQID